MNLFGWLQGLFGMGDSDAMHDPHATGSHDTGIGDINPANGLPMMGGGVDVEGNPYGTDSHTDMFDHSSQDSGDAFGGTDSGMMDDTFSSFDDM